MAALTLDRTAPVNYLSVFAAILNRDITVTLRELPAFMAQVILQPLFMLFVFGRVLADLGFTRAGYAEQLFPGIVAMTLMITAVQAVAFPLVFEFSFTKEIEDRLLAPIPTSLVAIEKVVFAAIRAWIAGLVMFPVGFLVLGRVPFALGRFPLLALFFVLGALAGGALGLTLGTLTPPSRINIMFALVLTPLIFTGCTQYPWPSLSHLPWFQVVTLFNPITYVSEGLRASLLPKGPHMTTWVALVLLTGALVAFTYVGVRGFRRRAID
ncbi:MAG: ABC transporter permease [Candidatus Dormibacter sp.]